MAFVCVLFIFIILFSVRQITKKKTNAMQLSRSMNLLKVFRWQTKKNHLDFGCFFLNRILKVNLKTHKSQRGSAFLY